MNKKERPRYSAIRMRATEETRNGLIELSKSLGGMTEAHAIRYIMTMGLIATMHTAKDQKVRQAAKKFWKEHWDPDGLIPEVLVLVNNP